MTNRASLPSTLGGIACANPGVEELAALKAPASVGFERKSTFWVAVALIAAALVPALQPPWFGKLGSCGRLLP